jgi:hypothetical protein
VVVVVVTGLSADGCLSVLLARWTIIKGEDDVFSPFFLFVFFFGCPRCCGFGLSQKEHVFGEFLLSRTENRSIRENSQILSCMRRNRLLLSIVSSLLCRARGYCFSSGILFFFRNLAMRKGSTRRGAIAWESNGDQIGSPKHHVTY